MGIESKRELAEQACHGKPVRSEMNLDAARVLHLPSKAALQHTILHSPLMISDANGR